MNKINRIKHINEHGTLPGPLFDRIDILMKALDSSQEILAEYLQPDSKTSDRKAISELLGVLDDRHLVNVMRDISEKTG